MEQKSYDGQPTGTTYSYWPGTQQIATRTWARTVGTSALTTSYDYDAAGRLTRVDYSDATPDVTYTLRRDGSPATTTDAAGLWTHPLVLTGSEGGATVTSPPTGPTTAWLAGLTLAEPTDTFGRSLGHSGTFTPAGIPSLTLPSVGYTWTQGRLSHVQHGALSIDYTRTPRPASYSDEIQLTRQIGTAPALVTTSLSNAFSGLHSMAHLRTGAHPFSQSRQMSSTAAGTIVTVDPDLGSAPAGAAAPGAGHWQYDHDGRGQVTSATRKWAVPGGTDATVPPATEYGYDDIGNRTSVTATTGSVDDVTTYTTNTLNQYTGITHPRGVVVTGLAPAGQSVEIVRTAPDPAEVPPGGPVSRAGDTFFRRVEAPGTDAAWIGLAVAANVTGPPAGTVGQSGSHYVPTRE